MRKKGISFVLSLAMVAGLAPNVANAAEKADDVQAFLNSRNAVEAEQGPTGGVEFNAIEVNPEELTVVESNSDAVSVEVAARDYDQYGSDYVYNRLNADEKAFYDALMALSKKYITTNASANVEYSGELFLEGVSYGNLTFSRAKEIYFIFQYTNPQYYFLANYFLYGGGTIYPAIYQEFTDGDERAEATEAFFTKVDAAVAEVNKAPTECYKALAAHDVVCNMTTYDTDFSLSDSGYNQTAWSTFMMDETVCAGYSKAYTIVANGAGLDTVGDTSPQGTYAHAWNRVKVEDGWYYVDCTWDDDPDGVGTVGYSFLLIGQPTLFELDETPNDAAHTTEDSWKGLLPDCPKNFEPGMKAEGILVTEQDNNKIVAGAVASHSLGKENLEYQWQVAEMNTSNWTLIQDWNDSEWLGWAPKRTGNYVIVCNVRDKNTGETVQLSTGVNFVINEAHVIGKCQMPWWGPEGGFLIGFTSDTNPNQSYQYEVQILDCTKYANGEDAWVWSSGKHTVSEGTTYWTVWQPEYGYYWTLFIVYDANGTEVGRACYGFENIGE